MRWRNGGYGQVTVVRLGERLGVYFGCHKFEFLDVSELPLFLQLVILIVCTSKLLHNWLDLDRHYGRCLFIEKKRLP